MRKMVLIETFRALMFLAFYLGICLLVWEVGYDLNRAQVSYKVYNKITSLPKGHHNVNNVNK